MAIFDGQMNEPPIENIGVERVTRQTLQRVELLNSKNIINGIFIGSRLNDSDISAKGVYALSGNLQSVTLNDTQSFGGSFEEPYIIDPKISCDGVEIDITKANDVDMLEQELFIHVPIVSTYYNIGFRGVPGKVDIDPSQTYTFNEVTSDVYHMECTAAYPSVCSVSIDVFGDYKNPLSAIFVKNIDVKCCSCDTCNCPISSYEISGIVRDTTSSYVISFGDSEQKLVLDYDVGLFTRESRKADISNDYVKWSDLSPILSGLYRRIEELESKVK